MGLLGKAPELQKGVANDLVTIFGARAYECAVEVELDGFKILHRPFPKNRFAGSRTRRPATIALFVRT